MSKHNKVNPGQYYVGGRLTPDEIARERMKQQKPVPADDSARRRTRGTAGAPGSPRVPRTIAKRATAAAAGRRRR